MRSYAAHVPVVTFAMYNKAADVFADKMRFSLWETEVIVKTPVGALQIITPLIARHNVYNILAAVAVGLAVTVDGEPIPLKASIRPVGFEDLCWLKWHADEAFVCTCTHQAKVTERSENFHRCLNSPDSRSVPGAECWC